MSGLLLIITMMAEIEKLITLLSRDAGLLRQKFGFFADNADFINMTNYFVAFVPETTHECLM